MKPARIPFGVLRVPEGKIAASLDIAGVDRVTVIFRADNLDRILKTFEINFSLKPSRRHDVKTHVLLRRAVVEVVSGGEPETVKGAASRRSGWP